MIILKKKSQKIYLKYDCRISDKAVSYLSSLTYNVENTSLEDEDQI